MQILFNGMEEFYSPFFIQDCWLGNPHTVVRQICKELIGVNCEKYTINFVLPNNRLELTAASREILRPRSSA